MTVVKQFTRAPDVRTTSNQLIRRSVIRILSALALELGFCSHSHFTLAFRRAFDCTPSEWRARFGERAV